MLKSSKYLQLLVFCILWFTNHAQNPIAVFYSDRDGNREIYKMNLDGSYPVNLTNNAASDNVPALCPLSGTIAFISERDGNPEIYVMNHDGSNPMRLTSTVESEDHPAFNPDGSMIFFMKDYGSYSQIWAMNSDGNNVHQITSNNWRDERPIISPDGNTILFMSNRDGRYEVYTMDTAGNNQTRITNSPGHKIFPVWSPDAAKIAYSLNTSSGGNFQAEIHVMNADGTNDIAFTNTPGRDENPCWTNNGTQILFQSERDGNFEIYIMNADGSNQTRLTNDAAWDGWPCTGKIISSSLLNYPESVIYDAPKNRYLISCQGTGAIVQLDAYGNQNYFASGFGIVIGLAKFNNKLYAVCNNSINIFDLNADSLLFSYTLNDAVKLNDIAVLNDSIFYIGDVLGNKIYEINCSDSNHSILAQNNLSGPNGLLLEPEHNRLLVISWQEQSPLQAVDINSGEVNSIFETGLSFCDGLIKDQKGNYYISEWNTGSIHCYDSAFGAHDIIYSSNLAPADIYYVEETNQIAIPLVYGHKLEFININSLQISDKKKVGINRCYPNPVNGQLTIDFYLPETSVVHANIYDYCGKQMKIEGKQKLQKGHNSITLNCAHLTAGVYYVVLYTDDETFNKTYKIIKI